MRRICTLLLLSAISTFAIGYQHGIFASQSTQGTQWRGTSAITAENYSITVMPSYLDIELDWEFDCKGGQAPDSFKTALEIVGNLNLAQDAAVTGMLLWNGDEILKAKLKPLQLAREQYEKVVDRNAPTAPRPRDPVIFEYGWGKDNYEISIFPVTWQSSRKLRMRYVVEAINMNGQADIPFPTAFNPSIATYRMVAGAGVASFEFIDNNGQSKTIAAPATFNAKESPYAGTVMVRPMVKNSTGKSVFYTASINLETAHGTLTHVVGRTGAQVIAASNIKEDFVVVWRWNHPEFFRLYVRQIVRQAETLKLFLTKLVDANKRAALVVDIAGQKKTIFDLGAQGSSSYRQMIDFVDSLAKLDYSGEAQPFNPGYSTLQIDSIVALNQEEFEGTIRLAMSMFEKDSRSIRRIMLLTAGPRCITKYDNQFIFQADSNVEISPFSTLNGMFSSNGVAMAPEAMDFYWPGVNPGNLRQNAAPMIVEAMLTTESEKTLTVPVATSTMLQRYSWGIRSPHLDKKLYVAGKLKPRIDWRISRGNSIVAEFTEEPLVVTMPDAVQFGCALAGTESLAAVDGTLPVSPASTFGFVDKEYALLALEEDVMAPLDQERYRIAGVPPLTNTDIIRKPDETAPPKNSADAPVTGLTDKRLSDKVKQMAPTVTMCRSILTVSFNGTDATSARCATIGIYTLSGRLLVMYKDRKIVNGILQLSLPYAVRFSKQTLLVAIQVGNMKYTRTIAMQ